MTQGQRQPGSNFKPFLYSAALENGFTPATLINDAPVVFDDPALEGVWRPENYSGRFFGPTRLREGLVKSRNLVSVRVLISLGVGRALDYIERFGFDSGHLPRDLSLALGSGTLTPLEVVSGYSVFANGGYEVEPYFIDLVENRDGQVVQRADPLLACTDCALPGSRPPASSPVLASAAGATGVAEAAVDAAPAPAFRQARQVLDPRNVYVMRSILQDVVKRGTGRRALALGRNDLAGKTGTTNDQYDAWFSGFNSHVAATAWVGYDNSQPLGNRETGSRAALPIWIDFMKVALEGVEEDRLPQPEGLISMRIDSNTGEATSADNPNAIFEIFRVENAPAPETTGSRPSERSRPSREAPRTEQLF